MDSTIFTTVATPSGEYLVLPHTLSVQKRKGSGKIFLDSTNTTFRQEWQTQAQTVFTFVKTLFSPVDSDFFISVDCQVIDGWSTSVPLFLLAASSITGEPLPKNIFSTGCMPSPDGFIDYGNFKSTQAKIDALEHLAVYSSLDDPQFLVPFARYEYSCETVQCTRVASMFSALKIALPETFQHYKSIIKKLSHVTTLLSGKVLEYIPSEGDAFVIHSPGTDAPYTVTTCGTIPVITEELPPDDPVTLYIVSNCSVVLTYRLATRKLAVKKVLEYKKILRQPLRRSVVF